ncbi:flavin monoamine oxidase family protein [Comamonas badia]|uniref:flavin monoamine oxidase family protein n=1 Tax=Comamonas badia TaxID=265291 RepID=UPI00040F4ADC|nr:FAD-dependent oxidoreductase [Comamonas badia]
MPGVQVAIVGAGLSGLYAATLLEARGMHDYVLLEARDRCGGRILSEPSAAADRFDLGATWFWPMMQPALARLVDRLGLTTVAQHEDGDMLLEPAGQYAPRRVAGYRSDPAAVRLAGGMDTLTEALRGRLAAQRLVTGCRVRRLIHSGGHIEVQTEGPDGPAAAWRAAQVLLAVPPRLAAGTIACTPALPDTLARAWQGCTTWMAPHAKYVAVFDAPFWREQDLSGEARSAMGPMAEIHDASAPDGLAALFGFLGIPAALRGRIPEETLRSHCRAQLVRLFGHAAGAPRAEYLKDWAADPCTATAQDQTADEHHAARPPTTADAGAWSGRLIAIASECSPTHPGYAAGALDAALRGVEALA